jgi:hypothetical protein
MNRKKGRRAMSMQKSILAGLLSFTFAASASGTEFTSPNGQTGAGLSTDGTEKVRLYGEGTAYLGFGTQDFFGDEIKQSRWAFPLLLGAGYRIIPELELEARMSIAVGRWAFNENGAGSFTPGNLYLGANYLWESGPWLVKATGGVAFGPWTFDPSADRTVAYALSVLTNLEDYYMYLPETLSVVTPSRIEYRFMPELAFTGDVGLGLYIPFSDGDEVELVTTLAPGAAYLTNGWVFGGRLPIFWIMTDDLAQFAVEPYVRYDFGQMFANARFTLNLDDPYGFSFDRGEVWAFHAGVGGKF